jgi:hypothetical protein
VERDRGLFIGCPGTSAALAICLLITLLTTPPPKEALDRFYSAR